MKKRVLSLFLAVLMMMSLFSVAAQAANETSGTCGANATWRFDASTGTLTISGTGAMDDYVGDAIGEGYQKLPAWNSYRDKITSLVVEEGITRVGNESFGSFYFRSLEYLKSVSLPSTLTEIGECAFAFTPLASVTLPAALQSIGSCAFYGTNLSAITIGAHVTAIGGEAFETDSLSGICVDPLNKAFAAEDGVLYDKGKTKLMAYPLGSRITDFVIPSTVTGEIELETFWNAKALKSITIPAGVTMVNEYIPAEEYLGVDGNYKQTMTLYFEGVVPDTTHWEFPQGENLLKIDARRAGNRPIPTAPQYIYDTTDPGEAVILPTEKLDAVTSTDTAVSAVSAAVSGMTAEQKTSATGADWATLFAEETVSRAASKEVTGAVVINAAAIADLQKVAETTAAAVDSALVKGGVATARYLASTVSLTTKETGEISIQIAPDVLTTKTDKVRVETPTYAVTIQIADLADELKAGKPITITAQDVGTGFAPGGESKTTTVKLNLPNGRTSNPVTLSLPATKGDATYQAVTSTEGKTVPSKRNPATSKMDAKIAQNGTYTVKNNQKDFNDISKKSMEMQKAIRYLASKGIIGGTTETTFSPDGTISRAEVVALLMRALGKLDDKATCTFTDIKPTDWYYTAAGSSAKHGIINGMGNGTFAGKRVIAKDQIVAVSARVLRTEMKYKMPQNAKTYLGKYSDAVSNWAQSDVALATRENLVVQRKDGTFKGTGNMTRGDAAIIIYRLFNKIW